MIKSILLAYLHTASIPDVQSALCIWSQGHNTALLAPPVSFSPQMLLSTQNAVGSWWSANQCCMAVHLHVLVFFLQPTPESGKWINAFPIFSIGQRMDNSMRLGVSLYHSHTCHHCGSHVTSGVKVATPRIHVS